MRSVMSVIKCHLVVTDVAQTNRIQAVTYYKAHRTCPNAHLEELYLALELPDLRSVFAIRITLQL